LTEWPDVLLGNFEAEYLALPEEVLVTVMRDHQKYFAMEDASGKLAPHFLTVTNVALDETNASIIKQGNERVLRARFNDARFFWEFDQRTPLVERVRLLENVTFQKDLGMTYAEKSERVRSLAGRLVAIAASRGAAIDAGAVDEAATLAKTDLTTELVKEFTELQGQIGGLYARSQGMSVTVADAIYDQYLPASAKDGIPRSVEGAILGLADRINTIGMMFSVGMDPTGSKDPFALRRAANSVVRILAESSLPLRLSDMIESAPNLAADVGMNVSIRDDQKRLLTFFAERIEFYLREGRGQAYDVVKAVVAAGADDIADLVARAEAVSSMRGSENFLAVSAAFKRIKNILAQNLDKGDAAHTFSEPKEFHPAQEELRTKSNEVISEVDVLTMHKDYVKALEAIATLRPTVDAFFEQVMVNDSDTNVRASRLHLLAMIVQKLSSIADFSEIVTAG